MRTIDKIISTIQDGKKDGTHSHVHIYDASTRKIVQTHRRKLPEGSSPVSFYLPDNGRGKVTPPL